ncbi:RelA/SpoT domain-containing protein [archaeon]|nr:RelA/SpoT domain-containing protein [archaeon]
MVWIKSEGYSKKKVDWAGNILININSSVKERDEALRILDNWRAIHRYPMHIFKKRLKLVSEKIDKNAVSVQRLKRLPSVLKKLQRVYHGEKSSMKLSRMQDIAGCRAVVSNVSLAKKLYREGYLRSDLKHTKVNEKDYISYPKPDGYRSLHLVYRYKSNKEGKKDYNGLQIEIQIRSKIQHLWATAIETVDLFTKQAIKSNEGEKEWKDFFRLVSSAFAIMEKTPLVPNTPTDLKELYTQIKEKEKELQVIKIMSGWASAVRVFRKVAKEKPNLKFFLLELDVLQEKLNLTGYSSKDEEKALLDYSRAEKINQNNRGYDVVLVGADKTSDLEKAYPNYFVDTGEFLKYLEKILDENN